MAVTSGVISRTMFMGLSSDTKPLGPMIDFAAQFYEYDTGKTYIWTGSQAVAPAAGQWVEYLPLCRTAFDLMNPQT